MKNVLILVLLLHGFLFSKIGFAKNCQFEIGKEICVDLKFKNGISRKFDSSFEIQFARKTDLKNKKGFKLDQLPQLKLWMVMKSGHGHGSEKLNISQISGTVADAGKNTDRFLVTNVWFMMLGQWDLVVALSIDGVVVEGKIPICVKKDIQKSKAGVCPQ